MPENEGNRFLFAGCFGCSDDRKGILGPVGAEVDNDKIELLLSEVKGKYETELIASCREKLASVTFGMVAPAAAQLKKEEKVEEKEESDDDTGFKLLIN